MNESDEEYDNNVQHIIKSLSYSLKHPVTVIHADSKAFLVIKDDSAILAKVPNEYSVKKDDCVYFKKDGAVFKLDFENYTEETKQIIIRFLQFDLQSEINRIRGLWQPSSGDAFFSKESFDGTADVSIYNGFIPRIVELEGGGGFGICVDVTKKYLGREHLPYHITREHFKRLRLGKYHLVHKYGNRWYEIRPEELSDLNVSQYKFNRPEDGKRVTILEDVREKFKNQMPPEVAKMPDDASVLIYRSNARDERRVAAALCYKVFDTEELGKLHRKSIQRPFSRRRFIRIVRDKYLKDIRFGGLKLQIAPKPRDTEKKVIPAPDLEFRNKTILSVRGTNRTVRTSIEDLGRQRKSLLTKEGVGFYTNAQYERQYFIMPETTYNTYGNEQYFLGDLMEDVDKMHPTQTGWKPLVITYDDRNKKTTTDIGFEIIEKIQEKIDKHNAGYAVVMLPARIERNRLQHDELAALVVSECFQYNINASIMHGDTLEESFEHQNTAGVTRYKVRPVMAGKYMGYIRGVAINQVLLNNERWPFILSTPLFADVTIGIDVKRHIAGFTFIDKQSRNILTKFDKSPNKEKLSVGQVIKMLVPNITLQAKYMDSQIETIVFHRDGRLYKTERDGILKAIEILKEKGIVSSKLKTSIIEIPKSSIVPFRLFEISSEYDIINTKEDNNQTLNPQIGSWVNLNGKEAFLCTTGREFRHDGTSNPLYIKHVLGDVNFERIVEDVYYLSCLAYTKPDDCSRFPLTIKITDRRINTLGSEYDSETLEVLKAANINV